MLPCFQPQPHALTTPVKKQWTRPRKVSQSILIDRTLHVQEDLLGRSPMAHANSEPLSDGGGAAAGGGDDRGKLTSLSSMVKKLPKAETEAESGAAEDPGAESDESLPPCCNLLLPSS